MRWRETLAFLGVTGFVSLTMSVDARDVVRGAGLAAPAYAPTALVCDEVEATVAAGWLGTARRDPLIERYALVSDPIELCARPPHAPPGGRDLDAGRCYRLRTLGTGEPDVALFCVERWRERPGHGLPRLLDCDGSGHAVLAVPDGRFELSIAPDDGTPRRESEGTCSPL
ncbi:MAG: hypothetical protein ACFBWO_03810 [Paracoccaceae bacterium]